MSPRIQKVFIFFIIAICLLAITAFYVRVPFGNWLFEKGLEAKAEWKLEEAVNYFAWSARVGNKTDEANFEKAVCYQLQGEFIKSQAQLEKLLASSIINQELKAKILNINGQNLFNQNKSDKALESHQEGIKVSRLINNKKLEAENLIGLSRVLYHTKGKFDEAKTNLEKSLKIGREINDELIIAHSLRHIGVILWWGKGELDRPLEEFYKPALKLYRKNNDRRSEAMMLSNISFIHSFKGDGFGQRKFQNESLAIREKIGDKAGMSESYRVLGNIYLAARNLRKGRDYLLRSIELAKKIGFRLSQNESETYLGAVLTNLGEYDEAVAIFKKLYEREKDNPILALSRLGGIANCYYLKGDLEKALEYHKEILEMHRKEDVTDVRSWIATYTYLGMTYVKLGNLEKAEESLNNATKMREKNKDAAIRGLPSYNIAQAELNFRKGNFQKSLKFLKEAADDELTLFASSGTNLVNSPFPEDYAWIFSLLLEKLNKEIPAKSGENNAAEELAFRFLEQRRYRSLRNFIVRSSSKNISTTQGSENEKASLAGIERLNEQLKTNNNLTLVKNLRDAYSRYENIVMKEQFSNNIQNAIKTARPVKIKTAQENLDEETALIEYIFVEEKTFALVLTKESLRSFLLPVTRSNVKNKVKILQSSLVAKKETEDWQPIAESLREGLIKPIEDAKVLEDKTRLAIVPFAFLHDLPFAVLPNKQGRFLVEDYVLFYPPSATFLQKEFKNKTAEKFYSFGINKTENLPDLKFAVEESKSVTEIFAGESKIEDKANETEFKKIAPKANHLHISTHAIAEPEMPLFSRMLLKSTQDDDGNLTVREIFELGIDAELVTIAACEGAKSFSADQEGLIEIDRIGLTEAFLHGGSKSVLASLSPASDKATKDLMTSFYTNLLEKDKATSLANAQREMLNGGIDSKFTHPKYWANFVLIGTDQ